MVDCINSFESGLIYASRRSNDFDWETFFSKFHQSRIDNVSGEINKSLPENHLNFKQFVQKKIGKPNRFNDWAKTITEYNNGNDLDALYTFFALLEEYRIEYDN